MNRPSRPKDQQIFRERERCNQPRSHAALLRQFPGRCERLVVDALLNLEGTDRFGGVGGFVNISRHRRNILVNGLGAFLFGKRKILRRRIIAALAAERLDATPFSAARPLFRRLLLALGEREALHLFTACLAFFNVVSALVVPHKPPHSPTCRAVAIRRRINTACVQMSCWCAGCRAYC